MDFKTNNQVLFLDKSLQILNALRRKVAIHNHLDKENPIQLIDVMEVKPECIPS
jgi:hypothetical protein